MFGFNKKYFLITLLLFTVEILIAIFVHDSFVRPYIGDLLVVMLMYCFIKSFCRLPVTPVATGVLLFSYLIEISQLFKLRKLLGWEHSTLAQLILGTSFAWIDIAAYTLGIAIVITLEKLKKRNT